MSYKSRAEQTSHPVSKKLLNLMEKKQTNLCVSVDIPQSEKLLALLDTVGPEICLVKTHVDIIEDFTPAFTKKLRELADKHNFMIFEDRKFADIGNTVLHQYSGGMYNIVDWADIVNAHSVVGPGIIQGLKKAAEEKGLERGLLLLAEMSSSGNLATGGYTHKSVEMAEANQDFVVGFISMRKVSQLPGMIHMTPGVQLEEGTDQFGQQYKTPNLVIGEYGSDIIIVGRGIYRADDPLAAAKAYRAAGWEAYKKRI